MEKIIIGIAYHKAMSFIKSDIFLPIQVGAERNVVNLGIQKDSDGDNISADNAYCSEMSATYWLWKNTTAEYKGLFHYRRFLSFRRNSFFSNLPRDVWYYTSKILAPFIRDMHAYKYLYHNNTITTDQMEECLNVLTNDILSDIDKNDTDCYVMGYNKLSTWTVRTHLCINIGDTHIVRAENIVKETLPELYPYFMESLNDNKFIGFNMIIAKNSVFNEYCEYMFKFLNLYHSYMNEGINNSYVNNALLRDSGYIAEILTDSYIRYSKHKGIRVKHLNCTTVDIEMGGMSSKSESITRKFKDYLNGKA